ncbi:MAG TPA: F0F1 ATP synthase subunit A [Hellea balneolensis]|uniref:ATP synthase subunit a n=1 Tax=Hellea balneolensis TaxID=287478 RepID=A0A7C5QVZ7_9PROT|nr:F0F1 ATP synthase subunit A [Hellea balneolensis]
MAIELDPIEQFEIHKMFEFKLGGFDLGFTNSSFMMVVAVGLISLFLFMATTKRSLIPGRLQSVAEMSYEFVANMVKSTAGKDGLKFFPFIYALFMFILFANLLGLIPFFFTTTSHIVITVAMALAVWLLVIFVGLYKHGFKFFKLFVPSGVPWYIIWFVVILEVISFFSRPLSHSVRLWANMLAGHIMLKLFAGFIIAMLGASGLLIKLGAIGPAFMTLALTPLEILVAFLQAYVFAILTSVYISDALHPGH